MGSRNDESSSTTGGISFIHVINGGSLTGIGSDKTFRGFIFSETNSLNIYKAMDGGELLGGIYQKDDRGKFRIEGQGTNNTSYPIYYDQNVLSELKGLGIFVPDGGPLTPQVSEKDTLVLKAGYSHIIGELKARTY